MSADERDVLRRLADEADELRGGAYPGDLMQDIRARLDARPAPGAPRWRRLASAAAVLALAAWLVQRRPPTGPPAEPARPAAAEPAAAVPAQPAARFASRLSPLAAVQVPAPLAGRPPALGAIGVPGFGAALSRGARALARVRAPSLPVAIYRTRN